jgi:hypothetical protein
MRGTYAGGLYVAFRPPVAGLEATRYAHAAQTVFPGGVGGNPRNLGFLS